MTWSHWEISPFITSVFFILGVLTLFWVSQNWLITFLNTHYQRVNESIINDWYGLVYMLVFVFGMQALIVGQPDAWIFMNFQLIALTFCGYFLNIRIANYYLYPLVLVFMIFNRSLGYWQSWGHALALLLFFTTLRTLRKRVPLQTKVGQVTLYFVTCACFGLILWWFMWLKFNLSWGTYWQEWGYLMIFEVLLYIYANMLSANAQLKQNLVSFANHDALTKTENFAAYTTAINYHLTASRQNGVPLTMMMFDIDHFKRVNDTYGHLAGDQILQHVTQVAEAVFKANNPNIALYRTGGEEFNVLFPSYDLTEARLVAEQLFAAVNHLVVPFNGHQIQLSISVGIAQLQPEDTTPTEFYRRVDDNLYAAKKHGRMQIVAK
ncbi:GGDEF domain-containing protein [Lactiplantibacillus pentosus]|uniref:GGDEF domain-containing protein n=1 Tax=Lactiplantibacillus pentosus TaxID=1589 RepID=UPI001ADD94F0|nr:GGDEF domain-containing protein [Lactiplantibacillus pentosus]MBO9164956.1 GGDEF domain-containing protein [Lactiplantibacillus pentosus]